MRLITVRSRPSPLMAQSLVAATMAVLVWLAPAATASAADEPAPEGTTTTVPSTSVVTVTVTAGLDDLVATDAPLVVDVELTARELVVGSLELDFGGSTSVAVEVPAGGVKRYLLEAASPGRRTSYRVTLRDESGTTIASHSGRVESAAAPRRSCGPPRSWCWIPNGSMPGSPRSTTSSPGPER
jgi:hypothetical protein